MNYSDWPQRTQTDEPIKISRERLHELLRLAFDEGRDYGYDPGYITQDKAFDEFLCIDLPEEYR